MVNRVRFDLIVGVLRVVSVIAGLLIWPGEAAAQRVEMAPAEAARLIGEFEAGRPQPDLDAVLTAYSRTLGRINPVYDADKFDGHWARLLSYCTDPRFDEGERYHLGWILAKYDRDLGHAYLIDVALANRSSADAPKIVFSIGNRLREAGEFDAAIAVYEQYIEAFAESTFFVNKAYQNIIDAHYAMGNTAIAGDMQRHVADLINDIGDAVAQMNLARQFDRQGNSALGRSTYALGVARALGQMREAQGAEKDTLAIEIAHYAHHFKDARSGEVAWAYAATRREDDALSTLAYVAKYYGTILLESGNPEGAAEAYRLGRLYPGSTPETRDHLILVLDMLEPLSGLALELRQSVTALAAAPSIGEVELTDLTEALKFNNLPTSDLQRSGVMHSALGPICASNLQTLVDRLDASDERKMVLSIVLADILVASGFDDRAVEVCDAIVAEAPARSSKYRDAAEARKALIASGDRYFPELVWQ